MWLLRFFYHSLSEMITAFLVKKKKKNMPPRDCLFVVLNLEFLSTIEIAEACFLYCTVEMSSRSVANPETRGSGHNLIYS
jgi:hypothetical protein